MGKAAPITTPVALSTRPRIAIPWRASSCNRYETAPHDWNCTPRTVRRTSTQDGYASVTRPSVVQDARRRQAEPALRPKRSGCSGCVSRARASRLHEKTPCCALSHRAHRATADGGRIGRTVRPCRLGPVDPVIREHVYRLDSVFWTFRDVTHTEGWQHFRCQPGSFDPTAPTHSICRAGRVARMLSFPPVLVRRSAECKRQPCKSQGKARRYCTNSVAMKPHARRPADPAGQGARSLIAAR
jgi:hypothetical protein